MGRGGGSKGRGKGKRRLVWLVRESENMQHVVVRRSRGGRWEGRRGGEEGAREVTESVFIASYYNIGEYWGSCVENEQVRQSVHDGMSEGSTGWIESEDARQICAPG